MKYTCILLSISALLISSCNQPIKNDNAKVYDEVMDSSNTNLSSYSDSVKTTNSRVVNKEDDIYGYWVGDFEMENRSNEENWDKVILKDEGLSWWRTNKINISIHKLANGKVYGHSVVAGNYRPFEGTYKLTNNSYVFEVKEPGDDRYDGTFKFEISKGDTLLSGTWEAFKDIEIKNREYNLQKRRFQYNPDQALSSHIRYANWDKEIRTNFINEMEGDEGEEFMDFKLEFESATEEIYNFNASNSKLKKEDIENLKQGDLFIIRNTIYARHGYSFKNRPLRVFFDQQPWYIPVHNDIKKDLTEVEKENIKLLMKYEKNAKAYYDYFGRG